MRFSSMLRQQKLEVRGLSIPPIRATLPWLSPSKRGGVLHRLLRLCYAPSREKPLRSRHARAQLTPSLNAGHAGGYGRSSPASRTVPSVYQL